MPIKKNILIVGGAGYIGSHMSAYLEQNGFAPLILDNFCTGHRDAVLKAEWVEGDMADVALLETIFSTRIVHAVMHFASYIAIDESMRDPGKYYQNNVAATLNLLRMMQKHDVKQFIFSSSAAVYGEPRYTPIDEQHPKEPINPYGRSKYMVEQILADFSAAHELQYAVLRYFNAAGADPSGKLSERHDPETHLIPLLLQVAGGQRKAITVYGRDYPTLDGTCVRDYVHVMDLCAAHLQALNLLDQGVRSCTYNLGAGIGHSVQQVIDAVQQVTQHPIPVVYGERRPGDPAILVADIRLAIKELNWQPRFSDLNTLIQHAWDCKFYCQQPLLVI